jgi:hypothetical protein
MIGAGISLSNSHPRRRIPIVFSLSPSQAHVVAPIAGSSPTGVGQASHSLDNSRLHQFNNPPSLAHQPSLASPITPSSVPFCSMTSFTPPQPSRAGGLGLNQDDVIARSPQTSIFATSLSPLQRLLNGQSLSTSLIDVKVYRKYSQRFGADNPVSITGAYDYVEARIHESNAHLKDHGYHTISKTAVQDVDLPSLKRIMWNDMLGKGETFDVTAWQDVLSKVNQALRANSIPDSSTISEYALFQQDLAYLIEVCPQGACWFPEFYVLVALVFLGCRPGCARHLNYSHITQFRSLDAAMHKADIMIILSHIKSRDPAASYPLPAFGYTKVIDANRKLSYWNEPDILLALTQLFKETINCSLEEWCEKSEKGEALRLEYGQRQLLPGLGPPPLDNKTVLESLQDHDNLFSDELEKLLRVGNNNNNLVDKVRHVAVMYAGLPSNVKITLSKSIRSASLRQCAVNITGGDIHDVNALQNYSLHRSSTTAVHQYGAGSAVSSNLYRQTASSDVLSITHAPSVRPSILNDEANVITDDLCTRLKIIESHHPDHDFSAMITDVNKLAYSDEDVNLLDTLLSNYIDYLFESTPAELIKVKPLSARDHTYAFWYIKELDGIYSSLHGIKMTAKIAILQKIRGMPRTEMIQYIKDSITTYTVITKDFAARMKQHSIVAAPSNLSTITETDIISGISRLKALTPQQLNDFIEKHFVKNKVSLKLVRSYTLLCVELGIDITQVDRLTNKIHHTKNLKKYAKWDWSISSIMSPSDYTTYIASPEIGKGVPFSDKANVELLAFARSCPSLIQCSRSFVFAIASCSELRAGRRSIEALSNKMRNTREKLTTVKTVLAHEAKEKLASLPSPPATPAAAAADVVTPPVQRSASKRVRALNMLGLSASPPTATNTGIAQKRPRFLNHHPDDGDDDGDDSGDDRGVVEENEDDTDWVAMSVPNAHVTGNHFHGNVVPWDQTNPGSPVGKYTGRVFYPVPGHTPNTFTWQSNGGAPIGAGGPNQHLLSQHFQLGRGNSHVNLNDERYSNLGLYNRQYVVPVGQSAGVKTTLREGGRCICCGWSMRAGLPYYHMTPWDPSGATNYVNYVHFACYHSAFAAYDVHRWMAVSCLRGNFIWAVSLNNGTTALEDHDGKNYWTWNETVDLVVAVKMAVGAGHGTVDSPSWQHVADGAPVLACTGKTLKQRQRKWSAIKGRRNFYLAVAHHF